MSISVLSSGNVIVAKGSTNGFAITTDSSSTTDITTVGVAGTATFTVTLSACPGEYFTLSNVKFTIYYYGDSYFTNTGTYTKSSNVYIGEKEISNTYIRYPLTFVSYPYLGNLILYFSNNQLIAEAY